MSVQTFLELRTKVETILAGFTACPLYFVDQDFDPPPISEDPADPASYVVCDPLRISQSETVTASSAATHYGDVVFLIYVDRRTGDAGVLELAETLRTLFLATGVDETECKFFEPRLDRALVFTGDDAGRYARTLYVPFTWIRG